MSALLEHTVVKQERIIQEMAQVINNQAGIIRNYGQVINGLCNNQTVILAELADLRQKVNSNAGGAVRHFSIG